MNAELELIAIAEEVSRLFPELEKRSVVVSDAAPTKENTPKLPIAMTMFDRMTFTNHNPASSADLNTSEACAVELWFKSEKSKDAAGNDTAYWAAYNHKAIAKRLIGGLVQFGRSQGGKYLIQAVSLEYDVNSFAVMLTFKFNLVYQFCIDVDEAQPQPVKLLVDLAPRTLCEEPKC